MENTANKKEQKQTDNQAIPLPEVTFSTFILSLNTSALVHLGEIPDIDNKKPECNLQLAKHAIDTMAMLKGKTEGNLSEDELSLIENLLFDLRMRFIKKST